MKVDRLLGIVMYLLNRQVVSASDLADKFEVSVRTIQRDIDSLTLAGIPIYAKQGPSGGYAIMESFKLSNQIMNMDDFFYIIKSLKSLSSAYENEKINTALEKIMSVFPDHKNNKLEKRDQQFLVDLSVLRESEQIDNYLPLIHEAINDNQVIEFDYTNSNNYKTTRKVEPLSITFKWYAWYLFAFCQLREDYRLFRVSRIRNLILTDKSFIRESDDIDKLLEQYFTNDQREYIDIKLVCNPEIRVSLEDFFANAKITKNNDKIILEASLPKNERF
jgi:predicted DNA-binding transcriptional regulator YafY